MKSWMVDGRPFCLLDGLPEGGTEAQAQQYAEGIWNWVVNTSHRSFPMHRSSLVSRIRNGGPRVSRKQGADDITDITKPAANTSIYATYQEGFDVF